MTSADDAQRVRGGAVTDGTAPQRREGVVRVITERGGTAPATWGQNHIWRCITWQSEDPAHFNFSRILPLPDGTSEPQLLEALARLVERHEALRMRFDVNNGGALLQTVRRSTGLRVHLHAAPEGGGHELAQELAGRLKAAPFRVDDADEPPVRCALLAEPPPGPALLVLVFDHLALDGAAAQLLLAELLSLLADADALPPASAVQPLDLAAFEAGPYGRRESAKALEHWRRNLPDAPRSLFDHPGRTPLNPRFQRYGLESRAAAVAATMAAARNRVSTSTVLLTAVAALLGARSGRHRLALQLKASNRIDPRRAMLVAPQAQNALFVFDCAGLSFDAAVKRSAVAALAAYTASAYDPAALDDVVERAAAERGAAFDMSVFFNDIRRREHWEDLPATKDLRQLEQLAAESAVHLAGAWDRVDAKFFVDVQYAPDHCKLYAQVDTAWITREEVSEWLFGVERLLMQGAFGDVSLGGPVELAEATGVAPVERGPDWVRCGPDWVRPADVEETVKAVSGVEAAWVEVVGAVDPARGQQLVAHLSGGGGRVVGSAASGFPGELREALIRAIGIRPGLVAPHAYADD